MSLQTTLKTRHIAISELKAAPYNPREISEKSLLGLTASLTRFGVVEPIIWNERTGYVVGGHQRLKVLEQEGIKETTVVVVDLEEKEEKALNITLNNKAIQGDWTSELEDILADLRGSLDPEDYLGLKIKKLEDEIPESIEPEPDHDPDAVPELPSEPKSKLGEIYKLDDHLIMCADSTRMESYERLFGDSRSHMIFTDPPYNVNYQSKDGKSIQNDHMPERAFALFLGSSFYCMEKLLVPGGGIYVCHADSFGGIFRKAFVESGLELKQCLIWVKNNIVLGRQDYQWKHEPILYGWKPGESHHWYGKRDKNTIIENRELVSIEPLGSSFRIHINDGADTHVIKVPSFEIEESTSDEFTSIWRFDKPQKSEEHPTMKPVGIPTRAIKHSSRKGDIVLDPFLGSGSTLIACEQLGRKCYGFELDPKYLDVIVKRWEDFTGKKAELVK